MLVKWGAVDACMRSKPVHGSSNGLSAVPRQAITWTNAHLLSWEQNDGHFGVAFLR